MESPSGTQKLFELAKNSETVMPTIPLRTCFGMTTQTLTQTASQTTKCNSAPSGLSRLAVCFSGRAPGGIRGHLPHAKDVGFVDVVNVCIR
jgi:hypothetical protein